MSKKLLLPTLLVAVLAAGGATAAHAAKIAICHRPPGNPGNFHTITINQNALPAHQAHGDLVGSCLTNCGTICDDGNKCTIDVVPSATECLCQAATRPPVDCSDGRACTTDSCTPAQGCLYAPVVCQAPDPCTASVCSEPAGTCETQSLPCDCPCVEGYPGFIEALNGQNGALLSCTEVTDPGSELVVLFTSGDFLPFASFAPEGSCGNFNSFPQFITMEQGQACYNLIKQKAAAAGIECLPPAP